MKTTVKLQPIPCMITALELIAPGEPPVPERQLLSTLALVERILGSSKEVRPEGHLLTIGYRIYHVTPIKPSGELPFHELISLVHLQADLTRRGFIARGVVTLGNAAARSDTTIGPGIAEADRLCNELAEAPQVIIDPRLLTEVEQNENLRKDTHTAPMELGYIRQLLREDSDSLWFIDYLKAIEAELDEPSIYPDFLEEHRQFVEQCLKACISLSRSSRRWAWLRGYHNRVIEEHFLQKRFDKADRARLLVPARSPLAYVFPPSAKAPD